MNWTRIWGRLVMSGGAAALVVAVACLKWYLWDVLVQQADQSDRSMIFWGLPVAFLGVASLVVAAMLGRAGRSLLRRPRD